MLFFQCYISAEDWNSASALARSLGPGAEKELARHRRMQLKTRGDIDGLLEAGEVEAALMLLAEMKEWKKCLDAAAERRHPLLFQLLKTRVEVRDPS